MVSPASQRLENRFNQLWRRGDSLINLRAVPKNCQYGETNEL